MSVNWADEHYVRLYTRDSAHWDMGPWQARAVLPLVLRKLDRAGLLDLGEYGLEWLAMTLKIPLEVVEPGIAWWLKCKTLELRGTVLVMPHYLEAQECSYSDKARKAEERARKRDRALAQARFGLDVTNRDSDVTNRDSDVTNCDEMSQAGHSRSQSVTVGHSASQLVTQYSTTQCSTVSTVHEHRAPAHTRVVQQDEEPGPAPSPAEPARDESPEAVQASLTDRPAYPSADAAPGRTIAPPDGSQAVETSYDLVRRIWGEMWRAKYGRPYTWSPNIGPKTEHATARWLGDLARERSGGVDPERWIRHWVSAYLREHGRPEDEGHPLKWIDGAVNKAGEPRTAKPRAPKATAVSEELPPLREPVRKVDPGVLFALTGGK